MSLIDPFDGSLMVIYVLLRFSRHACHVGNRDVSDDAASFCVLRCVPFLLFFDVNVTHYTDLQVLNKYIHLVRTGNANEH